MFLTRPTQSQLRAPRDRNEKFRTKTENHTSIDPVKDLEISLDLLKKDLEWMLQMTPGVIEFSVRISPETPGALQVTIKSLRD